MPISTNSIIHYTDSLAKLEAILEEGFAVKYCAEVLYTDNERYLAAHPMISFCDIPLSQADKHFGAYGRYGIGLSKDWANKHGVNPVLYLAKKSSITKTVGVLLDQASKEGENLTAENKISFLRLKSFTKNYSGHLKRKQIDEPDYRFYDEREWRLVPEPAELGDEVPFSITIIDYGKDKKKYNDRIASLRYTFEAKDISYIIVNKTREIPALINVIRSTYSSKCTAQELDILFSKICSTEQIIDDY